MKLPIFARRIIRVLSLGTALMLSGAGARADELPFGQPEVAYSGVTVTEIGGQAIRTRVFYTPGHQRNEMDTEIGEQIMLMDFESKVSYMLMPMARGYMEVPMGAHGMAGTDAGEAAAKDPEGTVEHEAMGRETIDGQETTKYRFLVITAEGSTRGFAWVTDQGILMRSEAETAINGANQMPGKVVITLQDLNIGPQDPALFELPADYRKMGQ